MKPLGIVLIVIAALWGIVALNMDTTVEVGGEVFFGTRMPRMQVNNIGLMDQRRNHLMGAGLLLLVGVVLLVAGSLTGQEAQQQSVPEATRKCPFCAELVRTDAIVCKHCGRDFPRPETTPAQPRARASAAVAEGWQCRNCSKAGIEERIKFCPSCGNQRGPTICAKCQFVLPEVARFCPKCGTAPISNPSRLVPTDVAQASGDVPTLRVCWEGTWMLMDATLTVTFNGQSRSGKVVEGGDVTFPFPEGCLSRILTCQLSVRSKTFELDLEPGRSHLVRLEYSKLSGMYDLAGVDVQ